MTDNVALLINLITLKDSGDDSFKLEVSRTYYDPEEFKPRKKVRVNGLVVCTVDLEDVLSAAVDWPCLRHESLERYMPAKLPSTQSVLAGGGLFE